MQGYLRKLSDWLDTKDSKRHTILTKLLTPKQSYENHYCHGYSTHTQTR